MEAPKGGMADLIDQALPHICKDLAPNTVKQYRGAARRLKVWLQEFAPRDVLPKDVAALKLALASKPNYANRCISLLRGVFDFALEQQIVDSNPVVGIKRLGEKKRGRLITASEYAAIYAKAGPRLQVVMDLLIRTGQRVTAVLRIHRTDLVADGIRFPKHKTEAKRVVRWTSELREVVERAKRLNSNIRALTLLCNRRGKAPDYSTIKIQWDKACRDAGVSDAHLHDLRAVALTAAKAQRLDPTALAAHSSPAMTARYLRDREEPVVDGPSFGVSEGKGPSEG
jgi:integrase